MGLNAESLVGLPREKAECDSAWVGGYTFGTLQPGQPFETVK